MMMTVHRRQWRHMHSFHILFFFGGIHPLTYWYSQMVEPEPEPVAAVEEEEEGVGHCKLQSLGDQTCVKEGGGGETSSAYYAATASNPFPTSGLLPIRGNTCTNKQM